jgi:hypothetical protein
MEKKNTEIVKHLPGTNSWLPNSSLILALKTMQRTINSPSRYGFMASIASA